MLVPLALWGDLGNMGSRYLVTQRGLDILILFWRIGQSPGIPQAHQAVMAIRQPHIIDAQRGWGYRLQTDAQAPG